MSTEALHERLRTAVGDRSTKHLGDLTATHPETVRRYMLGATPSAEFLAAICRSLSINADWLLTGQGPMKREDVRRLALQEARGGELLTALAVEVERLTRRVERLEVFVQTMETRLRAQQPLRARPLETSDHEVKPQARPLRSPDDPEPRPAPALASRITDAVARRSSSPSD